jgi:predicted protein tyrosine phosphatase
MDILVTNRMTIERVQFSIPYAVISISGTRSEPARLPDDPNRVVTLRLKFDDINAPLEGLQHFTVVMARRVWNFALECRELNLPLMVVHCSAGISRSPGIAAAIAKVFHGDDSYYFKVYLPNSLVYRMLLKIHDE